MIKRLKTNFSVLIKYIVSYWSGLSALACVILTFISWEDIGISGSLNKILLLLGIVGLAIVFSIITIYARKEKRIFGDINKGVSLRYGDLMKFGFPKKSSTDRIVVIPVNRCFDLSCEENLIADNSIHGQWINKFINDQRNVEEIHNKICSTLNSLQADFINLAQNDKPLGYLDRYNPGTVVELKGDKNVTFYLWAVAELDEELKANCTEMDYYKAIQGLLNYYDSHGQGVEMYCPIAGDRFIRPIRETTDILHFLLSVLKFSKDKVHGQINIVVYKKMKSDISILEY